MARDIAQRFNHNYEELFELPRARVDDNVAVLQGLDGRKMSKSYNNTIPLFETEKRLKKAINKVKTNLLEPGEAKATEDSTVFQLWCAFSDQAGIASMEQAFADGIAWGEAKKQLFERVNDELAGPRAEYERLIADPGHIEAVLRDGADRAREQSAPLMSKVRQAVGIRPMA